ncbi:MAG TPA: patatin-like phospholipase family protein, partial [Spirochaetota bacterium]|nr:patatin-like phospholipase family protein [Spirochaetota bacterium]
MKCIKRIIVALSLLASLIAPRIDLVAAEKDRPRVGVVLSGGGAKGFAHIALLRRLEELGIPVDYIGGTSMGATIAALYAIGYTPDELERIARDTGWTSLFMEKADRNDRDIFSKTILQEFPIAANITEDVFSPKGLVSGQNISAYLSRLTAGYQGYRDFGEFRIPFLCVGTDMETGEQTVFREGDIVNSLRASMAIPTVFEPVKIDDRIYLDGGIVNNFPVREVRESGADIIIGVDVGAPLYAAREMTNFPKIVNQLISFNGMKRNEAQRDACDILIIPDISEFDAMSFERTDDIIRAGKKAVEEESDALLKLSERLKEYHVTREDGKIAKRLKKIRVNRIEFDNISRGSEKIARSLCSLKEGDRVTIDDIEKNVRYLYGTNYFNTVEYRIEQLENETVLRFKFDEKSEKRLYAGFS